MSLQPISTLTNRKRNKDMERRDVLASIERDVDEKKARIPRLFLPLYSRFLTAPGSSPVFLFAIRAAFIDVRRF